MITKVSDKELAQAAEIKRLNNETTAWAVTCDNLTIERDELRAELLNIANANPLNWDAPENDTASFREWAQSRARTAAMKEGNHD